MSISVFQIYFDEHSEQHAEEGFLKHYNDKKDDYFENTVIKELYEYYKIRSNNIKYIGVTSWKQNSKTNLSAKDIINHIQKDIESEKEKDVYLYTPVPQCAVNNNDVPEGYDINGIIQAPNIWERHKSWGVEPHRSEILLVNNHILPFNVFDGKWVFCDCNYWIAKKNVFDEYCEKILLPAIEFFERPNIKSQMPKWFIHSGRNEKCTSVCLILEGLFGSFLAHSNYSYSYICKKEFRRGIKKVNITDYEQISA